MGEGRIIVTIPPEQGAPDGIAVDCDGAIWVALWDGAAVHCYTPSGDLVAMVPMPTRHPTSVAFGGADLSTLYVTSARPFRIATSLSAGHCLPSTHPSPGGSRTATRRDE